MATSDEGSYVQPAESHPLSLLYPTAEHAGFAVPQYIEKHIRKCQAKYQHQTRTNVTALSWYFEPIISSLSLCYLIADRFCIYLNVSTQIPESERAKCSSVLPRDRTRGNGHEMEKIRFKHQGKKSFLVYFGGFVLLGFFFTVQVLKHWNCPEGLYSLHPDWT